jgi:hypothetical protein
MPIIIGDIPMQKVTIPASALLLSLQITPADEINISCELSTLNESDEYSTIVVDNSVNLNAAIVSLSSEVSLSEEDGLTVCSGVDQNTENTKLSIQAGKHIQFEYGGEIYLPEELAKLNSFHEAVLNSSLAILSMETVDGLLKQIMPCYASVA